jgi:two-component system, LuxR family, response regulator FixJ
VRAIQQGAVSFLQKPADEQELWESIQQALKLDRERRAAMAEVVNMQKKLALLTGKEYAVLELMAQEKSTRAIARELDVSVRTVEFRRARILDKLDLKSPMQLFHFAIRAINTAGGNGNNGHGKLSMAKPEMPR